jgi:2-polyprenyl-3-methyl-5-hydroxy-6-metoxy-1,4-benzoquinol methylase
MQKMSAPPVPTPQPATEQTVLDQLVRRAFGDFAAAMTLPLVRLGDRLGLYRALRDHGPATPVQLAAHCGIPEPVAAEWLANQAAAGYVDVDPDGAVFTLSPEQTAVFADEDSGACLLAAFQLAAAYTRSEPALSEALRTSRPYAWGDHDVDLFDAVERFYRPAYTASLVPEWIPALDGMHDRLQEGAVVADVGCGHGLSTVLMAKAYPHSQFVGIDDHAASIEHARAHADAEGVTDRVRFDMRPAIDLEGSFDLIVLLDALHDMGDAERVAARLRRCLTPVGACMVVEPFAGDQLTDNLTTLGRAYYAASTLACVPSALSQSTKPPLGAQAGPARLTAILRAGGFSTTRIAATTPFNLVLEARP